MKIIKIRVAIIISLVVFIITPVYAKIIPPKQPRRSEEFRTLLSEEKYEEAYTLYEKEVTPIINKGSLTDFSSQWTISEFVYSLLYESKSCYYYYKNLNKVKFEQWSNVFCDGAIIFIDKYIGAEGLKDKDVMSAMFSLSSALTSFHKNDKAKTLYKQALAMSKAYQFDEFLFKSSNALADLYIREKQYEAAKTTLEGVLSTDYLNEEIYSYKYKRDTVFQLARAYYYEGKRNEADEIFIKILQYMQRQCENTPPHFSFPTEEYSWELYLLYLENIQTIYNECGRNNAAKLLSEVYTALADFEQRIIMKQVAEIHSNMGLEEWQNLYYKDEDKEKGIKVDEIFKKIYRIILEEK
jgi:tetratricopeptide (TPR) repeat protein